MPEFHIFQEYTKMDFYAKPFRRVWRSLKTLLKFDWTSVTELNECVLNLSSVQPLVFSKISKWIYNERGVSDYKVKKFFQVSLKLGHQEIQPKEDRKVADCSVFAHPYLFQKHKNAIIYTLYSKCIFWNKYCLNL